MTILVSFVSAILVFASVFLSYDRLYLRFSGYFSYYLEETIRAYKELFVIKDEKAVKRELILICSLIFMIISMLTWPEPLGLFLAAAISLYAWRLPFRYLDGPARRKRVDKFASQMVDALTLMANGLRSGLNMAQSLQNIVDEMDGPVQQEFNLVLSENKLGLTLEVALENLARRLPSEDVKMFVTSVNILRETGGNIAETFDTITTTIRERLKLKNKIDAMTAQGRSSAMIVGGLPWGIGGVLYVLDPASMTRLFTSPQGWGILAVVLLLEFIGFVVISKIVAIKV